jgi:hypothetical protein
MIYFDWAYFREKKVGLVAQYRGPVGVPNWSRSWKHTRCAIVAVMSVDSSIMLASTINKEYVET